MLPACKVSQQQAVLSHCQCNFIEMPCTLQDVHPLDHAQELGAHCSGPELAAFIRRYFSVMQVTFPPWLPYLSFS